ncbi:MAG: hypothetical protein DMD91_16030 [Candidatus Rokuibacteriota bacterium]|nr:MAG: hypothetical protein DMD91_16030 [Candidatus Rokubacteria bacterium]
MSAPTSATVMAVSGSHRGMSGTGGSAPARMAAHFARQRRAQPGHIPSEKVSRAPRHELTP